MQCKLLESHIHVNVKGKYQSCCTSTDRDNVENISTHSPTEWLNSDLIINSKKMLSKGIWPSQCSVCQKREELGIHSDRLSYINLGPTVEMLDLRISNSCNLKCISCNPKCSSSIAEEAYEMKRQGIIPIMSSDVRQHNWFDEKLIEQFLKFPLKTVKFAGGEPMMIKFLPEFLDRLDPTVEIKFTSNFTLFNQRIYQSLKKFKKVNMSASIDAIGKRIEYIRYGSDWSVIENNILKYREVANVRLTVCLSVLNILYYDEIVEWAKKHEIEIIDDLLEDPKWLNIKNAPYDIKSKMNKLEIMKQIEADIREQQIFIENIKKLDSFRKISIWDYLPEVAKAYNLNKYTFKEHL